MGIRQSKREASISDLQPYIKREEAERVAADVAAFEAAGGKIERLGPGVFSTKTKASTPREQFAANLSSLFVKKGVDGKSTEA